MYTYMSLVAAMLVFIFGLTKVAMGLIVATEALLPYQEGLSRYLPGERSSGAAIDEGLVYIGAALALGTLAELAYWTRKAANSVSTKK